MKKAVELYSYLKENDGYFYGPGDYQPILDSFGAILVQVDDNDYQGDSRVLYKKGRRYGYLNFGWGSCSGCDALQACSSLNEVDELIKDLHNSIKWFTKKQCLEFFKNHDWEGDYTWHSKEQSQFVSSVIELLS